VEYWNDGGGRRIRMYDKFKEIQAHERRTVPEAHGLLRYEIQLRCRTYRQELGRPNLGGSIRLRRQLCSQVLGAELPVSQLSRS
jgi:hypothetical protein